MNGIAIAWVCDDTNCPHRGQVFAHAEQADDHGHDVNRRPVLLRDGRLYYHTKQILPERS